MMLRESFGLPEASNLIYRVVNYVLERGYRTKDIATPDSTLVGTKEMSHLLLEAVDKEG